MHSEWGKGQSYLRRSQIYGNSWKDMRAVCGRHAGCTFSQTCHNKRPVGLLWAWLDYGSRPEVDTKAAHKKYTPSREERVLARAAVMGFEGAAEFVDAEPGPADD